MPHHRSVGNGRIARAIVIALIVSFIGGCAWGVDRLTSPPANQAEAESHLDRDIIAYDVWGDTPVVIFQLDDHVYFDRLRLDLISIDVPPTPRWQWTGDWRHIESTSDPASVAWVVGWWGEAIYGQVNDRSIVSIETNTDGVKESYPIAAPGFLIRLPEGSHQPVDYRFLDANGRVVWMTTSVESTPPCGHTQGVTARWLRASPRSDTRSDPANGQVVRQPLFPSPLTSRTPSRHPSLRSKQWGWRTRLPGVWTGEGGWLQCSFIRIEVLSRRDRSFFCEDYGHEVRGDRRQSGHPHYHG
jgi:hypothetical protein